MLLRVVKVGTEFRVYHPKLSAAGVQRVLSLSVAAVRNHRNWPKYRLTQFMGDRVDSAGGHFFKFIPR